MAVFGGTPQAVVIGTPMLGVVCGKPAGMVPGLMPGIMLGVVTAYPMAVVIGINPMLVVMGAGPIAVVIGGAPIYVVIGAGPIAVVIGGDPMFVLMGTCPMAVVMGTNPMFVMGAGPMAVAGGCIPFPLAFVLGCCVFGRLPVCGCIGPSRMSGMPLRFKSGPVTVATAPYGGPIGPVIGGPIGPVMGGPIGPVIGSPIGPSSQSGMPLRFMSTPVTTAIGGTGGIAGTAIMGGATSTGGAIATFCTGGGGGLMNCAGASMRLPVATNSSLVVGRSPLMRFGSFGSGGGT